MNTAGLIKSRTESLRSINIPNSVSSMGNCAFQDCDKIPTEIKYDIIQRFGQEVFKSR